MCILKWASLRNTVMPMISKWKNKDIRILFMGIKALTARWRQKYNNLSIDTVHPRNWRSRAPFADTLMLKMSIRNFDMP